MNKFGRLAAILTALCAAVVLLCYVSNLNSGPFEDDFGHVTMATVARDRGLSSVWTDAYDCFFFRPFNMGLLVLSLQAGSWTVAHGAALFIHVLLALAVGWLAARLFWGRLFPKQTSRGREPRWLAVALGSAFFVHQGNTTSVLQLDTLSQCTSDLFSVLALLAAIVYCLPREGGLPRTERLPGAGDSPGAVGSSGEGESTVARQQTGWPVQSGRRARFAFAPGVLASAGLGSLLAMAGKEGGVSTPVAVIATVAFLAPRGFRLRKTAIVVATQVLAGLAYVAWRLNVQNLIPAPSDVQDRYSFALSLDSVRNFIQFVFVETVPWNSASLMWNRRPHEWALGVALGLLVVVAAALGWRRLVREDRARRLLLAWLLCVFVIWCTPFVLLLKVSEQEVYRLAIPTVLILGLGCWAFLRSNVVRIALPVLVIWCAWVTVNTVASVQKCDLLKHNARVAEETLEATSGALGDLSRTDEVWVYVVPRVEPWKRYSVVCVPEAALRARAPLGLAWHVGRPGLKVEFVVPGREVPTYRGAPERLKKVRLDIESGQVEIVADASQ
ncbi:MAG: hypothetical protein V2A71_08735 [Candidatus Eisenbacteria bacterium]